MPPRDTGTETNFYPIIARGTIVLAGPDQIVALASPGTMLGRLVEGKRDRKKKLSFRFESCVVECIPNGLATVAALVAPPHGGFA